MLCEIFHFSTLRDINRYKVISKLWYKIINKYYHSKDDYRLSLVAADSCDPSILLETKLGASLYPTNLIFDKTNITEHRYRLWPVMTNTLREMIDCFDEERTNIVKMELMATSSNKPCTNYALEGDNFWCHVAANAFSLHIKNNELEIMKLLMMIYTRSKNSLKKE